MTTSSEKGVLMYKLMVVDDKADVIQGIVQLGNWKESGFCVVQTASSGEKALVHVKQLMPDVVITDIKMPFMDGLTLLAEIKKISPSTKVIILSGYDYFEYAKEAVRLGAEEYLLKPARITMIQDAVLRAKIKLDQEQSRKQEDAILRNRLKESLPLLRDEYFRYLTRFGKNLDYDEVKQRFNFLGITLDLEQFYVVIIELDKANSTTLDEITQRELNRLAIVTAACDIFSANCQCAIFQEGHDKVVVLANYDGAKQGNEYKTEVFAMSEQLRTWTNHELMSTITISIGGFYSKLSGIQQSYTDAQEALSHKLYRGSNCVIMFQDIDRGFPLSSYPHKEEQELLSVVKAGIHDQALPYLDAYLSSVFDNHNASPRLCRTICLGLVNSLFQLDMQTMEESVPLVTLTDPYNQFEDLKTRIEIHTWLQLWVCALAKKHHNRRKKRLEHDMELAQQYIRNHYNENISIQRVAEHVCLSPTYFSTVFKDVTGDTFLEFLTKIRIEQAKELLLTGSYKVYEVANMVGYTDRRYFSTLFRKHTGVTPAEWLPPNNS